MVNQVNIFLFKLGGKICQSENVGLRNFGTQVGQAMDDAITSEVTKHFDNKDESLYDYVSEQVTNHLFEEPGEGFGLDLAALNLQRGREHGDKVNNVVSDFYDGGHDDIR